MATATVPRRSTAPTEAEIRRALEEQLPPGRVPFDPPEGIYDALDPVMDSDMARRFVRDGKLEVAWDEGFYPQGPHPGTLWADMRPSEGAELHTAIEAVVSRAMRDFLASVREGAIAATVAFAKANPDIPRGRWQPADPLDKYALTPERARDLQPA